MKVLMVEPGKVPYEKEIDGLKEMQAAVGGLIQVIYPFEEKVGVVCNEEGLINGMEFNRSMPGGYEGVFGSFFICGLGEEDFCSLTPEQIKTYRERFRDAEILIGIFGNKLITLKVGVPQAGEPHHKKGRKRPHDRE